MNIQIKQSSFRLLALFLLSITTIAFEINVMRTFAIGSWSNFGSMVISIALLGYGLAGTLLTFLQKQIKAAPNKWLSASALILIPAMALSHILAQQVPFNPIMIIVDSKQFLWIGAYYLIYSVPFFFGAMFIGVIFISMSSQIYKLYFWNMVGSGLGGFVILGCMYLFKPDHLVLPLLVLGFLTTILCFIRYDSGDKKLTIKPFHLAVSFSVFIVSFVLVLTIGQIKVSDFKPISYAKRFADARLDYHSYGPTGEMHVYSSSYFHFAPGLSDVAASNLLNMPKNAFKALYVDGSGPIGIQRKMKSGEDRYNEFLPMAAPYNLIDAPRVLLIKLGGGIGVMTANYFNASQVQVIEPDPAVIDLMAKAKTITDYNDHLLDNPAVNVKAGEPRAYCVSTKDKFDIIEIGLIDSVGLSQTGGYSVDENYTYTVGAFKDYMKCLDSNGILSITVWNRLTPPRNVPKLLSTITASLKQQGIKEPGEHIFVFDLLFSTATVLVKKTAFSAEEISKLKDFCKYMDFKVSYYPGIPVRNKDFNKMLAAYAEQFSKKAGDDRYNKEITMQENAPDANNADDMILYNDDFYHFTMQWLLTGKSNALFNDYIFDITPATDTRPYYTAYLKPQNIPMFLDKLGDISEEWGYLLLLGTLVQSILFGLLIILIPMIGNWKSLFKGQKGTGGVILYYAFLGLAYMLVEIFLIQRLVFFLGNPIFSVSIVITSMLIISGLGSLFSSRFAANPGKGVRIAFIFIAGSMIFYMFGLSPLLNLFLGLPFMTKVILSILFIAPAAFFMGVPFPSGLSALTTSRPQLLPWAWGMNGALSVTGSVIAKLSSISFGFTAVLILALVLYGVAALVFKANEGKKLV